METESLAILIGVIATGACSLIAAVGVIVVGMYTAAINAKVQLAKIESEKAAALAIEAKAVMEREATKLALDVAATKVATEVAIKTAAQSRTEAEVRQRQLSEDLKGITLQIDGRLTQLLETVAAAQHAKGVKDESDRRENKPLPPPIGTEFDAH